MKTTVKFFALTLVATLGLTACGDGKSKKKDSPVETQQTTDVTPADKTPETVTAVESSKPTEVVEVVKEEPKPEVPATPEGGSTDQKGTEEGQGTGEGKDGDAVLCTADVISFCVKAAKGRYEEVSFGRSAPECKFPEAPADAVDIELCRPELGGSKTN